jgi:hypothetical protein
VTGLPWVDNLSDWLYQHSTEFHAVLITAVVLTALAGLAAVLRRSLVKLGLVVVLPALTAIAVLLVADAVAARSSARDIARRVHEVATTLPPTATTTAMQVGGNFHGETYQVPGEIAAVSRAVESSMRAAFDRPGATGLNGGGVGGGPTTLTVSFIGRGGCDGSVDVMVISTLAKGTTMIEITGTCED